MPWPGIDPQTSNGFDGAQKWLPHYDPLILDLDGDGIETIGASSTTPILFDHDGDGIKTGTGWVKSDDGFLVFDRNGNGVIDNGTELFGDSTDLYSGGKAADGFAALVQEDTNHDGMVDNQDANWNQLKVWRDLNQDGLSQADELLTLNQAGIASISTSATEHSQNLSNGNRIDDLGTYTRADGSTGSAGQIADATLAEDTFHREFIDTIPLVEGVAQLPEMQGSGKVRDLHEAASVSNDLKNVLGEYSLAATRQDQRALLDPLLEKWADTSGMASTMQARAEGQYTISYEAFGNQKRYITDSFGQKVEDPNWTSIVASWETKLHVLEAFNGRYFFNLPNENQTSLSATSGLSWASGSGSGGTGVFGPPQLNVTLSQDQVNLLNQSYDALAKSIYTQLLMQTRFKPLLDQIDLVIDDNGIKLDFSALEQHFQDEIAQDPVNGLPDLIDFNRVTHETLSGSGWDGPALIAHYMTSLPLTPELLAASGASGVYVVGQNGFSGAGSSDDDVVLASDAGSTIYGNDGNDIIIGKAENDVLNGGSGTDALVGGSGNDTLRGGTGSDTYLFAMGDGIDRIEDYDSTIGNVDTVQFQHVASTEVASVERRGDDLVLQYGIDDQVTVTNYFSSSYAYYKIEQFKFGDGVVWDEAAIKARVISNGTTGDDAISGYNDGANRVYGLGGNDRLYGGAQADLLDGGTGSDALYGNGGDDTLVGGTGNDTLSGSSGNDIYMLARGDGSDCINNYDPIASDIDALQFQDVASTEVTSIERKGDDLVLQYGTDDQVTVSNYFYSGHSYFKVEQFRFSDGVTWDDADIKARAITRGTDSSNSIYGYRDGTNRIFGLEGNDYLDGGTLEDLIDGGAGNDRLYGNGGDDVLIAGSGDDSVDGGAGDDFLTGGTGNDALSGGIGNDTYVLSRGDGIDHISDYDSTTGNIDTVQFQDVASTEVTSIERKGDDLVLQYCTGDQLTVSRYFYSAYSYFKVEQFRFSDGVTWDETAIKARVISNGTAGVDSINGYNDGTNRIYGLDGNDYLYGGAQGDLIDGGAGNDRLYGNGDDDVLIAGSGDDSVDGGAGDDLLTGGTGNDMLSGGIGNDTYVLSRGDGIDRISDYDSTAGNTDTVQFQDVASTEVTSVERKGDDLVLQYGADDQVTVSRYFYSAYSYFKVEQFRFSDGVTWDETAIKARVISNGTAGVDSINGYNDGTNRIYGLDGNDYLYGGAQGDLIDGGAGNDRLYGNGDDDVLIAGSGDDSVDGGAGDDLLTGGTGNDMLSGGIGNDTYVLSRGDGIDRISDYDSTAGNTDTVRFQDVASTDMRSVERMGDDLILQYGTDDQVTVTNYFSPSYTYYRVEEFRFSDGVTWDDADIKARTITHGTDSSNSIYGYRDGVNRIYGLDGNDYLVGGALGDLIDGGAGNDRLYGNEGDDILIAGSGDDTVDGGTGNDLLTGGTGNDMLSGGAGNDLYILARGDGNDRISDYDSTIGNIDTVQFQDVASAEVTSVERNGDDLILQYGTDDQVTVTNYFSPSYTYYRVEKFRFSDGVTWDDADIKARTITHGTDSSNSIYGYRDGTNRIYGLDGNDYLVGGALADQIDGGAGNDRLYGSEGNDVLIAGSGDDTVDGGTGNDLLTGGTGNDTLSGGAGNDLYLFSRGDGSDRISDYDSTVGNVDTVQFQDVASTGVTSVERMGDDLILQYGADDQVTVTNYFSPSYTYYRVEEFRFSDGVTWDDADIKARAITHGTDSSNSIYGYRDGTNRIYGLDGNDYLVGGALDDLIDGGAGDDRLYGSEGNDIMQGGAGVDILGDSTGNNLFDGGIDNDTLLGGTGNELFIGASGNDDITTGTGKDVIAFNRGDGQDTVAASIGNDNTLSLGGGIIYADLLFSKSGSDLTLTTGTNEEIRFKDWYASSNNCSVSNLQILTEGTSDYDPTSTNQLNNRKIVQFDFNGLVGKFDQARTADPMVNGWSLSSSMLEFYLAGSDTAAIGGDLAYQYARDGSLSGISVNPAQALLSSGQFGAANQSLQSPTALQDLSPRLM